MKTEKQVKVFLYFLGFKSDDLLVFYDNEGVAAVSYKGAHAFLQDSDVIRHCFEEGYIYRKGDISFILYAFTDDISVANTFEESRNMNIFVRKKTKLTKEEFSNLNRFKEAKLSIEPILYASNQYMSIAMTRFEMDKVSEIDEETIISDWGEWTEAFEFLPMEDGCSFNDECLGESVSSALQDLKFRYLLGIDDGGPIDRDTQINEWNVFYACFSDTLC